MIVRAPGKLILSGEHAVVYGNCALATTVDRFVTVDIRQISSPGVGISIPELSYGKTFSFAELDAVKRQAFLNYQGYLDGKLAITDVLHDPLELVQVTVACALETMNPPPAGFLIELTSSIPIGSGMGSSAAMIVAVLYGLFPMISTDELYTLALKIEHLQHGRSSGLDVFLAVHGGCYYGCMDNLESRDGPAQPLWIVDTGKSLSTTGECVAAVNQYLRHKAFLAEFQDVVRVMNQALYEDNESLFKSAVRANHQLLVDIGVVPKRVQQFIRDVEALGGAAKVCGAGAIEGEQAGVVMVILNDPQALQNLCISYSYPVMLVNAEERGVHVVT